MLVRVVVYLEPAPPTRARRARHSLNRVTWPPEGAQGSDPFATLGVATTADADELRAARRRLAKELHPDRSGGDERRMRELNLALDAALAAVGATPAAVVGEPASSGAGASSPPRHRAPAHDASRRSGWRVAHDVASFTIEALPVEAFEAVLVAASWLGDLLVDDPPYLLEVDLGEPFDCWCRLDLVPDAGASTVSVMLASRDARPVPDLDAVRDAWVSTLNQLGRPD